jgi:hypothetical protein
LDLHGGHEGLREGDGAFMIGHALFDLFCVVLGFSAGRGVRKRLWESNTPLADGSWPFRSPVKCPACARVFDNSPIDGEFCECLESAAPHYHIRSLCGFKFIMRASHAKEG